jgi:hypothetical protein
MSGLLDDPAVRLSDRDFRAWTAILDRLARQAEAAVEAQQAVAYELGFDSRRPKDVKPGDRVRHYRDGNYYEVLTVSQVIVDPETDQVDYVITFVDAVTAMAGPDFDRVIVAMPDESVEPF